MLLLCDEKVEGVVRERLLVSYLRYVNRLDLANVEGVCELLRRTGYVSGRPPPRGYPEAYLGRSGLRAGRVVAGRVRAEDLYHQLRVYPHPAHRSTALATQAAMLYLILYLAPDVLESEFVSGMLGGWLVD